MSDSTHRRPIKTRRWSFFQRLAAWLSKVGVSPNAISVSSMAWTALAGAALAATGRVDSQIAARLLWLAAAICIQLRLIANLLDGLVAVEGGKRSPTGELYNEAPDRVSDTLILIGAGYSAGGLPAAGAAAALVALFVAYVRALGASIGVGQVFAGPMAKQHRMAVVTVVAMLNAIAPTEWSTSALAGYGLMSIGLFVIVAGGLLTAAKRLTIIARRMSGSRDDRA